MLRFSIQFNPIIAIFHNIAIFHAIFLYWFMETFKYNKWIMGTLKYTFSTRDKSRTEGARDTKTPLIRLQAFKQDLSWVNPTTRSGRIQLKT